ncbi:hypothetical protein [Undibacterium sp. Ren11W]|uniref:hypothetical protein n=1 Tax=Undibacterium sp. Ren11W TaxID=3413045 RepID=UPI003BF11200
MRPLGYLYKSVAKRPDWLKADRVEDVYALSGCISENFADYIIYWKHNGYWLFNSPEIIESLVQEHSFSLEGMSLFYYEGSEEEFDDRIDQWVPYEPENSFETDVRKPSECQLEGFDVTNFTAHTSPECSPLSCNSLAESIPTNKHCLFDTFEEAKSAIETKKFENAGEPGPYRIIAVYSVPRPNLPLNSESTMNPLTRVA